MHPWTVYPSEDSAHPRIEINDSGGEILIIAGVHGDEPSGWEAIKDFYRGTASELTKPISFLFANPTAARYKRRYIERDLNRSFASEYDDNDTSYEMQLAGHLQPIIASFDIVISLHSTQSTAEPFALFGTPIDEKPLNLLHRIGISKAVYTPTKKQRGSLLMFPNVIEIECGYQHSERAKENAKRIIRDAVEFVNGTTSASCNAHNDVRLFSLEDSIPKPDEPVKILVDNLTTVSEKTLVAEGETIKFFAPRDFVPILVSANGYETILGYYGTELGWFSEAILSRDKESGRVNKINFPNQF